MPSALKKNARFGLPCSVATMLSARHAAWRMAWLAEGARSAAGQGYPAELGVVREEDFPVRL